VKQIKIKGTHPAYTGAQIRSVVAWVLQQLEIPAAVSSDWTVALGVSRLGFSGNGGGGCAIMRFTSRPLPAEQRVRDLVHLAAHELWHNEQHRRNGWRWPRTSTGKRKNMEPGARIAARGVDEAFAANSDVLMRRFGFEPGTMLPADPPKGKPLPLSLTDSGLREAIEALGAHLQSCPVCRDSAGFKCDEVGPLYEAHARAKAEALARRREDSFAKARAASKIAQAQKAERREARVRAKLSEWEAKAKAAQDKVREYRSKVRYYDRKAETLLAAAERSGS
jgi:hypothetical protein